ncbi:four helix bundle protein [Luteolibacter sp. Populi]|uniref:four helix bundle protein n=1 Tax=Luteolibacter sp. Populi TaxID=3230487 RepID=UPI003466BE66
MASYERFEDLPVWQSAIRLAEGCEDFLGAAKDRITWSKRDQLDRCSLSVSNNIAEGFERGSTNELLAFLYIARGSAGETRSMLAFFERRPALTDFKSEISNLKSMAESCSRQLRGWAESLQNSDISGPRHLNDRSREEYRKKKDADVRRKIFDEMERGRMAELSLDHPMRREYERKHGPLGPPGPGNGI